MPAKAVDGELVAPDRWRIPDNSIFAGVLPSGDYPANVDSAIELESPADPARELNDKLEEYAAMGIPHIWVVDPPEVSERAACGE